MTHICVGKLHIIGSDIGLSPGRRQAIIWTSAGIVLIGPLGTNFSEILIEIHTFSFKKMLLKMSSAKWRPFCLSPNVIKDKWVLVFLEELSLLVLVLSLVWEITENKKKSAYCKLICPWDQEGRIIQVGWYNKSLCGAWICKSVIWCMLGPWNNYCIQEFFPLLRRLLGKVNEILKK